MMTFFPARLNPGPVETFPGRRRSPRTFRGAGGSFPGPWRRPPPGCPCSSRASPRAAPGPEGPRRPAEWMRPSGTEGEPARPAREPCLPVSTRKGGAPGNKAPSPPPGGESLQGEPSGPLSRAFSLESPSLPGAEEGREGISRRGKTAPFPRRSRPVPLSPGRPPFEGSIPGEKIPVPPAGPRTRPPGPRPAASPSTRVGEGRARDRVGEGESKRPSPPRDRGLSALPGLSPGEDPGRPILFLPFSRPPLPGPASPPPGRVSDGAPSLAGPGGKEAVRYGGAGDAGSPKVSWRTPPPSPKRPGGRRAKRSGPPFFSLFPRGGVSARPGKSLSPSSQRASRTQVNSRTTPSRTSASPFTQGRTRQV